MEGAGRIGCWWGNGAKLRQDNDTNHDPNHDPNNLMMLMSRLSVARPNPQSITASNLLKKYHFAHRFAFSHSPAAAMG